jgi:hypothetical protein
MATIGAARDVFSDAAEEETARSGLSGTLRRTI